MSDHLFWIDWFRSVSPKLAAPSPHAASCVRTIDPDRLNRMLKTAGCKAPIQDLRWLRPLSPPERMIHWLKTQPADIVDAASQNLNWEQATGPILWLLSQPTTDAAIAVKLFLRAEPSYYVDSKADDPPAEIEDFTEAVVLTFAKNWKRYARGGVGYDPSEVSPYGSSDIFFINELDACIAKHAARGIYPLPPLPGLAGPFEGLKPKEFEAYLEDLGRDELFLVRFLFAGLGTWIADDVIDEADFDAWMQKNGLSAEQ